MRELFELFAATEWNLLHAGSAGCEWAMRCAARRVVVKRCRCDTHWLPPLAVLAPTPNPDRRRPTAGAAAPPCLGSERSISAARSPSCPRGKRKQRGLLHRVLCCGVCVVLCCGVWAVDRCVPTVGGPVGGVGPTHTPLPTGSGCWLSTRAGNLRNMRRSVESGRKYGGADDTKPQLTGRARSPRAST